VTKRVNRPHRKTGRKRKSAPATVTTHTLVEALAADGRNVVGVAKALSTSKDRLRQWMDEDPTLLEAFERGREAERFNLHNGLFRAAQKGNVIAAMFLLKTRHGYREGDQSDTANRVSITFTLPSALKPEDFKVIAHEPGAAALAIPEAGTPRS